MVLYASCREAVRMCEQRQSASVMLPAIFPGLLPCEVDEREATMRSPWSPRITKSRFRRANRHQYPALPTRAIYRPTIKSSKDGPHGRRCDRRDYRLRQPCFARVDDSFLEAVVVLLTLTNAARRGGGLWLTRPLSRTGLTRPPSKSQGRRGSLRFLLRVLRVDQLATGRNGGWHERAFHILRHLGFYSLTIRDIWLTRFDGIGEDW